MAGKNRMIPVIVAHVAAFFLTQAGFMALVARVHALPPTWYQYFFLISPLLHVGLAGFLIALRSSFYHLPSGEPMNGIGLANRITMFRISVTPTIMVLIMLYGEAPQLFGWILGLTFLAFVSDLLDGYISRNFGQGSKIGQYLDSSSDYIVLMMIGAVFAWYHLLEWWFFIFILIRYLIQWIMVGVLFFRGNRGKEVGATFLGKASVFATMTVMGVAVLGLMPVFQAEGMHFALVLRILSILCSLFLVLSLGEKVQLFVRGLGLVPGQEEEEA